MAPSWLQNVMTLPRSRSRGNVLSASTSSAPPMTPSPSLTNDTSASEAETPSPECMLPPWGYLTTPVRKSQPNDHLGLLVPSPLACDFALELPLSFHAKFPSAGSDLSPTTPTAYADSPTLGEDSVQRGGRGQRSPSQDASPSVMAAQRRQRTHSDRPIVPILLVTPSPASKLHARRRSPSGGSSDDPILAAATRSLIGSPPSPRIRTSSSPVASPRSSTSGSPRSPGRRPLTPMQEEHDEPPPPVVSEPKDRRSILSSSVRSDRAPSLTPSRSGSLISRGASRLSRSFSLRRFANKSPA